MKLKNHQERCCNVCTCPTWETDMMIPIAKLILFKLNIPSITPEYLPVDEAASLCDLYACFIVMFFLSLVVVHTYVIVILTYKQGKLILNLHIDFQSGACCQFNREKSISFWLQHKPNHPSFICLLFWSRVVGTGVWAGRHRHLFQFIWEDAKSFPGQPKVLVSPRSLGFPHSWKCLENRHPGASLPDALTT